MIKMETSPNDNLKPSSLELFDIPVDRLYENDWNPNEQDPETQQELADDIERDGFDEPLQVVFTPDVTNDDGEGMFRIIGGAHRFRAMRSSGETSIPCAIKEGWDSMRQKLFTVRRNIRRGALNDQKFTRLVNDIVRDEGENVETIAVGMGFGKLDEFMRHYHEEKEEMEKRANLQTESQKAENSPSATIDNTHIVLKSVMESAGNTATQDFIYFMYKRKRHLVVTMKDQLKDQIDAMVHTLKMSGVSESEDSPDPESINDFLASAISHELERRGVSVDEISDIIPEISDSPIKYDTNEAESASEDE